MPVAAMSAFSNALAVYASRMTTELMRGVTEFAETVRARDVAIVDVYTPVMFVLLPVVFVIWMWPIFSYLGRTEGHQPTEAVKRRTLSAPLVVALFGFAPWLLAVFLFPVLTVIQFGHWHPDLVSQHILSPLVGGFLAATSTYLLVDWYFRRAIIPRVFPDGRLRATTGATALGVQGRLFVYLIAVAFAPTFTMVGLIRSASDRMAAGGVPAEVMGVLDKAGRVTWGLYTVLGIGLTVLLARTLTVPLGRMARALERVEAGDLDVDLEVDSADEVGALEDGVNSMVHALRDRDEIMQAFGRVVEPAVRDRLLAGRLKLGGEMREASVLFIDLRGFTAIAEHSEPEAVVATLNAFFTVMTRWVRECGGTVDKFIGDAMLVVFGLFDAKQPGGALTDAGAAEGLRCALGVMERLRELNEDRERSGQPPLAVSMGLHTGSVLAGTIGAEDRHEYTVIGDTVNVAARLQQACKQQERELLVSEATLERARDTDAALRLEVSDTISLRGRSQPVRVFSLAGA